MSTYSPPAADAIHLVINDGYSPPAADAIHLVIGPSAPTTSTLLEQLYSLEDSPPVSVMLDQRYSLTTPVGFLFSQFYGLSILSYLRALYGDEGIVTSVLEQYYDDSPLLNKSLRQLYSDTATVTNVLGSAYSLAIVLSSKIAQNYTIAGYTLKRLLETKYDISEVTIVRGSLNQVFALFPDSVVSYETAGSYGYWTPFVKDSNGVIVPPGMPLPPGALPSIATSLRLISYDIKYSQSSYAARGSAQLQDYHSWSPISVGDTFTIYSNSVEHVLIVISKTKSEEYEKAEFSLELASPAVLLDFPYAREVPEDFVVSGTMSQVVNSIASLEGHTVSWHIPVDDVITDNDLQVSGESPMRAIKKVVNELGGIVQSLPDGTIRAVQRYKVDSDKYSSGVPAATLSSGLGLFRLTEETDKRDGYNKFSVTDSTTRQQWKLDNERVNEDFYKIKAYKVPWTSEAPVLYTSELTNVTITALPAPVVEELEEEVEITNGVGNVSKPCYGVLSYDYKSSTDLGTIDVKEDGSVSSDVAGHTLVTIRYYTRYWQWDVRDPDSENVQLILEA